MTSTTSLQVAVIVDLYPPPDIHTNVQHNDQLWATVSKLRLNDLSSYDVVRLYVLTSSPDDANTSLEQAGVSGEDVEVKVLATDDRIRAFYEAKQALDTEEISDIRLVCLDLQRQFWAEVCQLLFSEVHHWTLESVNVPALTSTGDTQDNHHAKHEPVLQSVQRFLTTLPSLLGDPEVNRSEMIPRGVFVHGYSTRRGGVTVIPTMSSMNLVYVSRKRDPRLVIDENRRRLAQVGGFDYTNFHIIRTEHGKRVWVVGEEQPVKFDGLVTNKRDVTIAAAGADCIPLLFADPVAMVIGAAHAGWRGTVEGVAGRVVQTMTKEFGSDPKDVRVAMGPCVLPGCFGVLPDETKCFADIDPSCVVPDAIFGSHVIQDTDGSNDVNDAKDLAKSSASGSSADCNEDGDCEASTTADSNRIVENSQKDTLIDRQHEHSPAQNTNGDGRPLASQGPAQRTAVSPGAQGGLRKDRVAVDLTRTNRLILEREGVLPEHIDTSTALCTRCNPHVYFSYERDGFPFGNQIGFICMPSVQRE
ncbi:hypothetical protein BaRGS_00024748 [Batillaria attramentaria]|uniref:Uncharacterized protein n=1 Tax=Batillaria attramentaria TaxID=370345 RepID=A0ABD0KAA5_9CAEN